MMFNSSRDHAARRSNENKAATTKVFSRTMMGDLELEVDEPDIVGCEHVGAVMAAARHAAFCAGAPVGDLGLGYPATTRRRGPGRHC
jgi:hypothetical protein